jgi:acetolactate synthase regulatory subunit
VETSRELQEARDSEEEAHVLRRQRVQMFRGFSARVMAAAHRLGIHGLNLPTVPEDDGSIMLFFSQLAEQLDGASAKVLELIDAECRELLGLAGTRIFSNIQRLRPDLNLEEVLQRPSPPPPGTPDRAAVGRAVGDCPATAAGHLHPPWSTRRHGPGELLQRRHLRLRGVRQRGSWGRRCWSVRVQRRGVLRLQPRHRRWRGQRGGRPVNSS